MSSPAACVIVHEQSSWYESLLIATIRAQRLESFIKQRVIVRDAAIYDAINFYPAIQHACFCDTPNYLDVTIFL